jgi:hypothetical protein
VAPEPFGDAAPPELEDDTSKIFIDIKTLFEEGVPDAYDWTQASNHQVPPQLVVMIQKPQVDPDTGLTSIPVSVNGCPQTVKGFFLDTTPDPDQWITEGVIVDQSSIQSVTDTLCSVKVQLPHFSKFAIGGVKALALGGVVSSLGGGSGGDRYAPNIGETKLMVVGDPSQGLGGIISDVTYGSDTKTQTIEPGQKLSFRVRVNENQGINDFNHIVLYTNIRGDDLTIHSSDTFITFDKGKPLSITDPHGFFSNVDFTIIQEDAINFILKYDITFAKPMEKSHIILQTWDLNRNQRIVTYQDAISVTYQTADKISPENTVPAWVKTNAKWWATGMIADSDFTEGIEFLVKEGIITLPPTQVSEESNNEIPSWIKNNAQWWADDLITEDDFIIGIQWMVNKGIINNLQYN